MKNGRKLLFQRRFSYFFLEFPSYLCSEKWKLCGLLKGGRRDGAFNFSIVQQQLSSTLCNFMSVDKTQQTGFHFLVVSPQIEMRDGGVWGRFNFELKKGNVRTLRGCRWSLTTSFSEFWNLNYKSLFRWFYESHVICPEFRNSLTTNTLMSSDSSIFCPYPSSLSSSESSELKSSVHLWSGPLSSFSDCI